ncbi:hypothetical protein [Mycobacteroides abscessus]|uniref:hypothetical protein n=1 Tax=Mycobacteroides abscessus TaxID=36809 RepID=UPI0006987268|nr:hypothetical protein [Mycobacteroides abscessus]SHQ37261.1 Uncharacterised protein [Mycobacteroides abscessus subsp. abscessus]
MSSTTANILRTALASVFLTAAATFAVAPASASPNAYCDKSSFIYDADLCAQIGDSTPGSGPTLVPTTTAPASRTGNHSAATDWIDSHLPVLIGIVVIGLIIAVTVSAKRDKKEVAAEEQRAALARGRAIAQDHHAAQVQAAHDAVAANRPDPRDFDPDGIGLAPPPMPAPVIPPPPPQSDVDLIRYAEFNAVVPWIPGSAFAAVVTRDGSLAPAETAWLEAARAARLGDFDAGTNTFTPAATLTRVEQLPDGEDVRLRVEPRDIFVTEQQLDRVHQFLVKTAHVASASPFIRDHSTGYYATVLSNRVVAAPAPVAQQHAAPAPQAAAYDDDDDWI